VGWFWEKVQEGEAREKHWYVRVGCWVVELGLVVL